MASFLIYGANGYTGSLIAEEAVRQGHSPILAGRDATAVAALADRLGLRQRVFGLDDVSRAATEIEGTVLVLNCAGPFTRTAVPLVEACLRTRTHYLDITGEVEVFESLIPRNEAARAVGMMLLPGAGFDVVPSDCLAAHLKRRLPTATRLALAFTLSSRVSRGTALTMLEHAPGGGLVRRGGSLTKVPAAWKTREIDFGAGPVTAVTIPWGDLSTAWFSTGIQDIEVYTAIPFQQRLGLRASRYLAPLLGKPGVKQWIAKRIRAGRPGPSKGERASGRSCLWGEVSDETGARAMSLLQGPEGYTMTVRTALAIVARVVAGKAPPGYQTPSTAYGPDFVLEVEGVARQDEES